MWWIALGLLSGFVGFLMVWKEVLPKSLGFRALVRRGSVLRQLQPGTPETPNAESSPK